MSYYVEVHAGPNDVSAFTDVDSVVFVNSETYGDLDRILSSSVLSNNSTLVFINPQAVTAVEITKN